MDELLVEFAPYERAARTAESFANAAHATVVMQAETAFVACGDDNADFHDKLKRYARRLSAALMELAPVGRKRLDDWLEIGLGHLCPVISPLKERGPPRG